MHMPDVSPSQSLRGLSFALSLCVDLGTKVTDIPNVTLRTQS